jgi:hypothetical protein
MKSYQPRLTETQAREKLTIKKKLLRGARTPVKIELIRLPWYFFRIKARDAKGKVREFCAGVDAVVGGFALADLDRMEETEIAGCEFKPLVRKEEVQESLQREAEWFLKHKARRGRGRYELVSADRGELAYYPFWVGYYKNQDGSLGFLAIDAISGVYQSGSARRIFIHAFAQNAIAVER